MTHVTTAARNATSLARRLLFLVVFTLSAVAVILGVGGYVLIERVAEQTSDRVLAASVRAIAETLTVDQGEVTLDLPASALGMLENNERDNVYYSVHTGGELLTGYADLPFTPPDDTVTVNATSFRYASYRDRAVRIATEYRRLPRINALVSVQVAETLAERNAVSRRLLAGLVLLEVLLVTGAGLVVWPAVRWSVRPITHLRKQIEDRSQRAFDFAPLQVTAVPTELRGFVGAFNSLLARVELSTQRVRHFTSDASHQMRTPLAVLRTHLALLRQHGTDTAEGRASLDDVEKAAIRLQRLLVQLVALARADEAITYPIAGAHADLDEVVEAVVERLESMVATAQVSVTVEGEPKHRLINGDAALVAEVITNVVDNGIRYNRPGGKVRLWVHEEDTSISLMVDDDGQGVPAVEREQVFQRFHRLARDQNQEGTGLGLSIVRSLTYHLGASIQLLDVPGGPGLRVVLRFQRAAA